MKEVIIHIGTHKTGTTTIQKSLKDYKDETTRVASFREENHSIPMFTIFSEHRYHYHIWRKNNLKKAGIDAYRAEYLKILEADLADDQYDRLIISGEDMSILDPADKHALVEKLRSTGANVKVIVFTRSPCGFACSALQQRAKGGAKEWGTVNVDYRNKIGPFLDSVGKENITVCDFDYVLANKLSLIDYFSEILGLKLHSPETQNESVTVQALALIHKLNNVPLKVLANAERWGTRQRFVRTISEMFPASSDYPRLDPGYFSSFLSPTVKEDCLWLQDTFGLNYSYEADADKSLSDYLEESLVGCESELTSLFSGFGSVYDRQSPLEDNFLEAYIASFIAAKGLLENDADFLRDIADKIDKKGQLNKSDSLMLMKLAVRARPYGPYIRKRVEELSAALNA